MLKTLCACRSVGIRMLARPILNNFLFHQTNRFAFAESSMLGSIRCFSSSASTAAVKEKPEDTSSETSGSGENNEIQPFEYKPSVNETVKILRKLAQKLDAGRPDFIPRGSDPSERIPIPAVGYWRKEGFTSFFVEVEPRPDGSREIEIELKWSDDKSKVPDEPSNISMGELTVLLRTLANALNSGAPRILQAGAKQIDIPSTHGGADVSVEYEVEDGTHELEIKVAI